jgi:HlyD family secretion protein
VSGAVHQVAVQVGDTVAAGDLLLALDTVELERAVRRAEIEFESARLELAKLGQAAAAGNLAVAEAELLAAQANLAKVEAGPTAAEREAAQLNLAAAQAKYQELLAPADGAEVNEAKAELYKAEVDVQTAQSAYDQVKWRADLGMLPESATLHKATIDYERALAKYNRLTLPAAQSEVQAAQSNIEKAEHERNQLAQKPTPAELAEARAKVADATLALARLQSGAETQAAELKVEQALINLDEAQKQLASARVLAPIAGTVLELKVKPGEHLAEGTVVATLADTQRLKLTINVAEVDVAQVEVGQAAALSLDALRDRSFAGVVEWIAPSSKLDNGKVNYPVTIRLVDPALDGVRPGMNAIATLSR